MKKILIFFFILAAVLGGLFYFRFQIYYSHGAVREEKTFTISQGERVTDIARALKKEGLVSDEWYFLYYLWSHGLKVKILVGRFTLNGAMTIPEIASVIMNEKNVLPGYTVVTFPEGWDSGKIGERLSANGFDGKGFLNLMKDPKRFQDKYRFFDQKDIKTLEGYLFPDTYFFSNEASADGIVKKILENFDQKVDGSVREEIAAQGKTIHEVITMASILETEVRSREDRELVSGIFWNRIKNGQPLQSDITLTYALGVKKKQYSIEDTKINSLYNTYLYKGLPPGPISNPGMDAILAALRPRYTEYNYFLSDPDTGETVFARTFEEHKMNKAAHGL